MNLIRSVLHNVGVIIVGFIWASLGLAIDVFLHLPRIQLQAALSTGVLLIAIGFLIRAWATYCFYQHQMAVIKLSPSQTLLTNGPFKYSRNPLYLGGNVFIFFGASLILGSPSAIALTVLHLPLVDIFMIQREEKQLELKFGEEWRQYKRRVRRWI